jgi:hypothetical protein
VTRLLRNPVSWVVAANVGLFSWLTGGRIVWPGHVSWLMVGDTASGYLGWEFFRRGPLTVWPPGASPLFGVGYSSSVVYADAIPLLALPMKFLLAFTDVQFQFLGAWLLACFVLQGVFAVKLLQRFGVDGPVLVPGALLFSIAPVFLYRMVTGGYGHMALAGHFLVLWALWLVLDPQLSHRRWAAVLLVSLLVQFYLFVMVGYFYVVAIGWWVWRHRGEGSWLAVGRGVAGNVTVVLVVAYLAGYFMGGSASSTGFGEFRADVLALIDPLPLDYSEGTGWSRFVADRLTTDLSYEGYGFVGIAVLALMPVAVLLMTVLRSWRRMCFRIGLIVAPTTLLAFSNRVRAGYREIATLELPDSVEAVLGVVRASGRFIWIVVYAVTALCVAGLVVAARRVSVAATMVVTALLCIQMYDQAEAHRRIRERFVENRPTLEVVTSEAWEREIRRADCIAVFPTPVGADPWSEVAEYALRLGKVTNAAYMSRWNPADVAEVNVKIQQSSALSNLHQSCARLDLAEEDLMTLPGQLLSNNGNPARFIVSRNSEKKLVIRERSP